MNFKEVLQKIEENSFNSSDKGTGFELLIKRYLQTDPTYSFENSRIYLWNEISNIGHDVGIDLVVKKPLFPENLDLFSQKESELIPVQCKFHKSKISQEDIAEFVANLGKSFVIDGRSRHFSRGILVSTSELTKTAEDLIAGYRVPINVIKFSDLEEAAVDWEKLYKGLWGSQAREGKKRIRDYQRSCACSSGDSATAGISARHVRSNHLRRSPQNDGGCVQGGE